jgi:hypothetical protein
MASLGLAGLVIAAALPGGPIDALKSTGGAAQAPRELLSGGDPLAPTASLDAAAPQATDAYARVEPEDAPAEAAGGLPTLIALASVGLVLGGARLVLRSRRGRRLAG